MPETPLVGRLCFPPMLPNRGQCRQMGCLGTLPSDEAEKDEYQPVERETARVASECGKTMWAMCVDRVQLNVVADSPGARLVAADIFDVG